MVDVEHATPEQFEAWRKQNGIPAKAGVRWSFEMRCKTINYCRFYGVFDALKFPIDFSIKEPQTDALNSADIRAEMGTKELEQTAPNSADERS